MNKKSRYDRKIIIDNQKDFDRYIADPETFLREKGALDGLPTFNGVVDLETEEGKRRLIAAFAQRQTTTNWHIFGPVPDFCKWIEEDTDPDIDD